WKMKERNYTARFIELADDVNSHMPDFVVQKATLALNAAKKCANGARVLVVGVAYKKNVSDVRESPALNVIQGLERLGAKVDYHDPYVLSLEHEGLPKKTVTTEPTPDAAGYDLVIVATDHSCVDYARLAREAACVLDCRDACRGVPAGREKIVKL
ncbi:MAG TPA: UDP binding domain-containing protein, partial [Planctomycetota bacterium]|nr:UDP binding domain-containing protein [Planctomycetota bacterium]